MGSWSAPKQLSSHAADAVQHAEQAQFSTDGSSWHFGFTAGDLFMRTRADGGAYSAAKDISAEASGGGSYTDYKFLWNGSSGAANFYEVTTAAGNDPEGWSDLPPDIGHNLVSNGNSFAIIPGPAGYQEKDLDVEGTTYLLGNYHMHDGEIPAEQAIGSGNTLADSLYRSTAPPWWTSGGFGGSFPPFNPQSPIASYSSLPAGADFLRNIPPELVSAHIAANGIHLVLTFTKPVTIGLGGAGGFTVSYSDVSASYLSGSGTIVLTYLLTRAIYDVEEGQLAYSSPTNGLEDSNGVDLEDLSGVVISNYSEETGGAIWCDGALLADANATIIYEGGGFTRYTRVVIEQPGLIVGARLHIANVTNHTPLKMAVYDAVTRERISSGQKTVSEDGNYLTMSLGSVHVEPGEFFLAFQSDNNNDPTISTKTGAGADSSFVDSAVSFAGFPLEDLPAAAGSYSYALVAGIRLIPDAPPEAATPTLRSARAPLYAIPGL